MLLSIVLMLLLLLGRSCTSCPSVCICKWKAGKEWVECAARGLQGLPQGAREETQVLDLSDNQLFSLVANCFIALQLVNLQRLYLSRSHIRLVAPHAFIGLEGLVELDLSDNEIDEVPTDSFPSISNLMRLNLAGNPIKQIHRSAFQYLVHLNFLELSRCNLKLIEAGAFESLHALEWLRLNDNLLEKISKAALPLTANLRGLSLHGNPWLCDCGLVSLHNWLTNSQAQTIQESQTICEGPSRLNGRLLSSLKAHELACTPKLHVAKELNAFEGENTTLYCEVQSIPQATVIWLFNGDPIEIEYDNNLIRYIYSEFNNGKVIIASLEIINVQTLDEGSYICQAENTAGKSHENLTLRVFHREHSTSEPNIENSHIGYATTIAAGALLGTLLALGCLFLSIFLYAQQSYWRPKRGLNQAIPIGLTDPSMLKKDNGDTISKNKYYDSRRSNYTSYDQEMSYRLDSSSKLVDFTDMAYLQHQQQQRIIEPDLINEVPFENDYTIADFHQMNNELNLNNFSNCLDRDGYPLNFGLPKIVSRDYGLRRHNYLNQQLSLENTVASPVSRISPENNIPQNTNSCLVYPNLEMSYTSALPIVHISSPSSIYRNESVALSPRSLLHINLQQRPLTKLRCTEKDKIRLYTIKTLESLESLEHLDSPDEGYVGDVMDV